MAGWSAVDYLASQTNLPASVPAARQRWREINGQQHSYFCGAYWGYGFHEDGVNSALAVCKHFGRGL